MKPTFRTTLSRLQESTRRKARETARKIPAGELIPCIDRYIEWRALVLWARAVVESEGRIPRQVASALERLCPGFQPERDAEAEPEFWLRLSGWIDQTVFRQPNQEGWLLAIHYYASLDLRWEQLWLYWGNCDARWRKSRPGAYPGFEEWRREAQRWPFPPSGGEPPGWSGAGRVSPDILKKAVSDYIDWEAFAYWVRAVIGARRGMPRMVVHLLRRRCPGFLEQLKVEGVRREDSTAVWRRLIAWIDDRVFGSAKSEGWFDAVTWFARSSLRAERTVAYWAACDEQWFRRRPSRCPGFEAWRRAAQAYIER